MLMRFSALVRTSGSFNTVWQDAVSAKTKIRIVVKRMNLPNHMSLVFKYIADQKPESKRKLICRFFEQLYD